MSAQGNSGVQLLLEAEKDARNIVEKARQYRLQRLKDARNEAAHDVEEYTKFKKDEFAKFEENASVLYKQSEEESKQEVVKMIESIKSDSSVNADKVVDEVLALLLDVKY
ncbi:V-type ATPase subunit G [Schizosaccharomyces japonicus yFS275]|uniref:V-type proton ATPase subunit G n=1 Tax=Schizosaccharomyces japonicus (strain yFS275 / FY16936) TaxID=402676 RepID=B6JXY7_SCHJY|nr:V-type ATPase subunit G [Schizosaccharomyces japonicus yFS275]EEB06405.2 V-type ATPase subunit G [Schizosaccharomyces japonicus yFS275]